MGRNVRWAALWALMAAWAGWGIHALAQRSVARAAPSGRAAEVWRAVRAFEIAESLPRADALGRGQRLQVRGIRADDLPHLLAAVREPDAALRMAAEKAIDGLADEMFARSEELLDALEDPHPAVAAVAVRILAEFPPAPARALPRLAELLPLLAPVDRRAAAFLLGHEPIGVDALAPAAARLAAGLRDPEPAVRHHVGHVFRKMGVRAASARGSLQEIFESGPRDVRADAALALAAVAPGDAKTVSRLAQALAENDGRPIRRDLLEALARLGERGAVAAAQVHSLLDADDPGLRRAACASLGAMGRIGRERLLPTLQGWLERADRRVEAAEALAALGAGGKAAIPALRAAIARAWGWEKGALVRALVAVGAEAGDALPPLLDQLQSGDAGQREAAARGIAAYGTAAAPVVADLARVVREDPVAAVRAAAARALGAIGPAARPARSALEARAASEIRHEAEAAREALRRIGG